MLLSIWYSVMETGVIMAIIALAQSLVVVEQEHELGLAPTLPQ